MATTPQQFKATDLTEKKVTDAFLTLLNELDASRDDFFNGAYSAYPLGDVLYVLNRHPLAGVLPQDVFRESFPEINELFTKPGTFEFYLSVFRKIWGESVEVEFTVPAPGKLLIDISALEIGLFDFVARKIVDNAYVLDEVIDHDGDNIAFQDTIGVKTQSQMNKLIFELSPGGVWIVITLSIG